MPDGACGTGLALFRFMRVAIAVRSGRISPVFDSAKNLLLVETWGPDEQGRSRHVLEVEDPWERARRVAALGTDVLVCGALSRPLEWALASQGIEVVCQVCGPVETVLKAYLQGRLTEDAFLMPGCCGRRRRLARKRTDPLDKKGRKT